MEIEKIRNTTDAELKHQQQELSDQLFRLKFQMKMGQNESLQRVRTLRKDIARIRTVARERELGLSTRAESPTAASEKPATKKAAAARHVAPQAKKRAAASKPAHKNKKKTEKK